MNPDFRNCRLLVVCRASILHESTRNSDATAVMGIGLDLG
jgi:hypothetical protein